MTKHALILLTPLIALAGCDTAPTAPLDAADGEIAVPGGEASASEHALLRSTWPSPDDPGPPFYARVEPAPPHVYVADGLAIIAFYRDPDCVPADFNLLAFFDPPAAFACALTVKGFSLWEGTMFVGAPMTSVTRGLGAVPVWFVPAEAVVDAAQDGQLTIAELRGLPGRKAGSAAEFSETLQPGTVPLPPPLDGGGHPVPKLTQVARGTLADGQAFMYRIEVVDHELVTIRIRFD